MRCGFVPTKEKPRFTGRPGAELEEDMLNALEWEHQGGRSRVAKRAPTEADATVSGHNPKKRRESFAPRPSSPPVVVQNFSLSSARANLKVSR